MRRYTFGNMFKRTVTIYENGRITLESQHEEIGNGEIYAQDIAKIFHNDRATFFLNGSIYLSIDGKDTESVAQDPLAFHYTKAQKQDIAEFLELVEIYAGVPKNISTDNGAANQSVGIQLNNNTIHCPKCHSTDVNFMDNKRKDFSVGKAVGGAVLTGGVGTLAGFAGKKGNDRWHCSNCGNVFEQKMK